jgi:hypothetical protein
MVVGLGVIVDQSTVLSVLQIIWMDDPWFGELIWMSTTPGLAPSVLHGKPTSSSRLASEVPPSPFPPGPAGPSGPAGPGGMQVRRLPVLGSGATAAPRMLGHPLIGTSYTSVTRCS